MKKILNDPNEYVTDVLRGLLAAHPDRLRAAGTDLHCIVRAERPAAPKVAIVTGGGSGHLPLFVGYVGYGLADGCAVGEVFSSPSAKQISEVTRSVHSGAGVLYLFGHYSGDRINFSTAAAEAAREGIEVETVFVTDDVASAPRERAEHRRGVAGLVLAYKVAGAMAERGANLAEVAAAARLAVASTRSMGVALSPCIVPEVGQPTFTLDDDEMEIGMGIHGESGVLRASLQTADWIVDTLMDAILADIDLHGSEVAVLVNSLGATPLEELYIMYNRLSDVLQKHDVRVYRPYIGRFATSMEMAGASISIMKLDDQLKELLDAPASSPFFDHSQFA